MKVLVLGGFGVLGTHLARHVDITYIQVGRDLGDITDSKALSVLMAKMEPDCVVNLAALTNVAYCEKNPEEALRVNAVGAGKAALAAKMAGAGFIQLSTDYVFAGYNGPSSVDDQPMPINAYGLSKRWGEQAVLALHPGPVIVRVGWLFGADYPSCPPMLAHNENYQVKVGNVQAKHRASIWDDLKGQPTHVRNVAGLLDYLVTRGRLGRKVLHFASEEDPISWYDFLVKDYPDIRPVKGFSWSGVKRPQLGGLIPSLGMTAWSYERALREFQLEISARHSQEGS